MKTMEMIEERIDHEREWTDWTYEFCVNFVLPDGRDNCNLHSMFWDRVPERGKADHLIGELVRAAVWIEDKASDSAWSSWGSDHDHIGVGSGIATCNPPAEFLYENGNDGIRSVLDAMNGVADDECYNALLSILIRRVTACCEELIDDEPKDFYYQHGRRYYYDEEE